MRFSIYRYNPDTAEAPRMQDFSLHDIRPGMMLLEALIRLKAEDDTLSFRPPARRACAAPML